MASAEVATTAVPAEVATTTLPAGPPSTTATVTASSLPTADEPTSISPGLSKVLQSTHIECSVTADTVVKQIEADKIETRKLIAEHGIEPKQALYLSKFSFVFSTYVREMKIYYIKTASFVISKVKG
jgi:hypothetical protein